MNRRELLRELSRVQATWVNRNTPGAGDVDITAEDEQDYLTRISAVFDKAREELRRKRGRSLVEARAMAASRAIEMLLAGYDPKQPRDRKGRWSERGRDGAPSTPDAKAPKSGGDAPRKAATPARAPAKKAAPAPAKKAATPARSGASTWSAEASRGSLSPEAEKAIQDTFAFSDPGTGMSAKVSSISPSRSGIEITVDVLDPEGRLVGKAVRTLAPAEGGRAPQMYHTSLFLGKRAQGGGFASRWLRQTEDNYRDAGIGSIGLTTNDVGSYAWAKAGFDFADREQVTQMGDRFKRLLGEPGVSPQVAAGGAELVRRSQSKNRADWPTPMEFAMLGWTPGATTWFGKEKILGTAWKGVKEL